MKIKLTKDGYWAVYDSNGKCISPEFHGAMEAIAWRNAKLGEPDRKTAE